MTPAERQEFQRLVCDLMDAQYADFRQATRIFAPHPDLERFDAALSALTAFVERLTAGEVYEVQWLDYKPETPEKVRLNHVFIGPQFTPGQHVRVTPLDGGTDGNV